MEPIIDDILLIEKTGKPIIHARHQFAMFIEFRHILSNEKFDYLNSLNCENGEAIIFNYKNLVIPDCEFIEALDDNGKQKVKFNLSKYHLTFRNA